MDETDMRLEIALALIGTPAGFNTNHAEEIATFVMQERAGSNRNGEIKPIIRKSKPISEGE